MADLTANKVLKPNNYGNVALDKSLNPDCSTSILTIPVLR